MAENPVLAELKAGLRAGGPDFADEPAKARTDFEATLAMVPVAEDLAFETVTLGGVETVRSTAPGADARRALLYLHGGGYIAGSAHGYRALAAELGRAMGVVAYSPEYRLAPEHRCPAAIEDACAAYRGLLAQGIEPENIVIAGDSAGGGLTVAALVALRDAGDPLPSAGIAISPWADLTCSSGSITEKAEEDASLTPEGLRAGAAHYVGDGDLANPLASPVFANLSGLPPLLIQVGSSEILLDDAVVLAGAAGQAGTSVRLDIWPEMPHVWHAFGFMLEEGRRAIGDAAAFAKKHLGK